VVCSTSGHTLYQVLELPQTASADDIKRAYRKVVIMLCSITVRTEFWSLSSYC